METNLMATPTKIETYASGNTLNITFAGPISEDAKFPQLNVEKVSEVFLDFGDVTYLNSAGVRNWIKWLWNFEREKEDIRFFIRRCSSRTVRQILAINNFIPKSTKVESFLIRFECESCPHAVEKLFVIEKQFENDLQNFTKSFNEKMTCQKCSSHMEPDTSPEDYHALLKVRE